MQNAVQQQTALFLNVKAVRTLEMVKYVLHFEDTPSCRVKAFAHISDKLY